MMSESTKRDERGRHVKTCFNCGREDTKGFSRFDTQAIQAEHGKMTKPPSTNWVCRPGFGCDGHGSLYWLYADNPDRVRNKPRTPEWSRMRTATEEDLERMCGPGGFMIGSLYRPKSFHADDEEEDESAPEAEPVDGEEDDSDS
jgi:hypothetical protein